jgi:hypothetical protein
VVATGTPSAFRPLSGSRSDWAIVERTVGLPGMACEHDRRREGGRSRRRRLSSGATIDSVTGTPRPASVVPSGRIEERWARPDGRRLLQLALATLWLFDGLLQLQAYFFTRSFGTEMIRGTAQGNPTVIAGPINWAGATIGNHAAVNSVFALMQVGMGLAIAWRPTVKVGLGASIAWSIGVWWVGEGLGGVFSGFANPVSGAPGAVILYALLAVLLWPTASGTGNRRPPSRFVADRAVGAPVAKLLWLVLWGSLCYFAVVGPNRSAQGLRSLLDALAAGEPGWMASINRHAATLVAQRGLGVAVALAVTLAVVAVGVYLPRRVANATLGLAILLSLAFWVVGQDFGTLFTNGATDLNSGPLLVLLALAYWQRPGVAVVSAGSAGAAGDAGDTAPAGGA